MNMQTLRHKEAVEKVFCWTTKTFEEAIISNDSLLKIQCYVLLEMCKPSSQNINSFESVLKEITPEYFLKTAPSLFLDFLLLVKKYQPSSYTKELKEVILLYKSILEEIKEETNNIDILLFLTKINILNDVVLKTTEVDCLNISENDFLLKSKGEIDKSLNVLLKVSKFGLKKPLLEASTIEAIETIMIDAATNYDLVLVTKALKVLTYAGIKETYVTEYVYNFLLNNQSVEGYIGHYEVEFASTTITNPTNKQLQITTEIITSILEYDLNDRFMCGLSFC